MKKIRSVEKILTNAELVTFIDRKWKDTGMPTKEITEFSLDLCAGSVALSGAVLLDNSGHTYHSHVANTIKAGIYSAIEDFISSFSYTASSKNYTVDALYSDKVKGDSEATRCVYQQNIFRYKNGARMQPGYIFTFVIFAAALLHTSALFESSNLQLDYYEPDLTDFADRLINEFDIPVYYRSKIISNDKMWAALLMGAFLVANAGEKDEFLHQYLTLFLQQYIEELHNENMKVVLEKSYVLEDKKKHLEESRSRLSDLKSNSKITAAEYKEMQILSEAISKEEREMEISFSNTYNNNWLYVDNSYASEDVYNKKY